MHSYKFEDEPHVKGTVGQRPTPRVMIDLNPPKPELQKGDSNREKANKAGPKETWVPKST